MLGRGRDGSVSGAAGRYLVAPSGSEGQGTRVDERGFPRSLALASVMGLRYVRPPPSRILSTWLRSGRHTEPAVPWYSPRIVRDLERGPVFGEQSFEVRRHARANRTLLPVQELVGATGRECAQGIPVGSLGPTATECLGRPRCGPRFVPIVKSQTLGGRRPLRRPGPVARSWDPASFQGH